MQAVEADVYFDRAVTTATFIISFALTLRSLCCAAILHFLYVAVCNISTLQDQVMRYTYVSLHNRLCAAWTK